MGLSCQSRFWSFVRYLIAVAAVAVSAPASAQTVIDLEAYSGGWRIYGSSMGDSFDSFVRRCDVNGDGLDDAVISAHEAAGPGNTRVFGGEAYVILGARRRRSGVTNIDAIRDVIVYGRSAGDNLTAGTTCGDVNGDGYDDLVLGAYSADAAGGQRDYTGQVHLVFGGPTLPPVIDLAIAPSVTIWGFQTGSGTGREVSVGDVNGDGIGDIGISSRKGTGKSGAADAGRAYIVFGRGSWPAIIDLQTDADVTIYGRRSRDYLGSAVKIGDLNRDGLAELLVAAEGGSGPGAMRAAAGDLYVFQGRPSWPREIDMATESPTTWAYGPDAFDAIVGSNSALAFGDIDADGSREVVVGIPNGDGPTNSTPHTGECRLAEFGGTFPTTLDLGTDAQSTVFGIAESERFGSRGLLQDVNGDGIDDLCIDTLYGDGPDETRTNAGEVHILYGAHSFPAVIDLALTPPDIIVYGQLNEDRISARDPVDLNGDGFLDVAINTGHALFTRLESLWLMSPFDYDGDGITQLEDNCPLVANRDQLDSNDDDRGDSCAADWDGDGQADTEDCAPNRTSDGTPSEVLAVGFATTTELTWNPAAFTDRYDILRGAPRTLVAGDYGECQNDRDSDPTDTAFVDPETPVAGAGFTYLIRGRNEFCPAAGSYGRTSDGTERTSQNPLACP